MTFGASWRAGSLGNLIHQPQASVSTTACKRVASQRGSLTPAATAVSGLSNPAAQDPVPCLPENLKPISSSLANELRRQQHLKKRLKKQLTTLQRQLHNMSNIASSQTIGVLAGEGVVGTRDHSSGSYSTDSASSSLDDCFGNGFREECEDPLFSTATPPSVEQLQRQLVYVRSQLLQSSSESLADVLTVTSKLQDMAACLDVSLDLVIHLVARYEPLLLQDPQQLPPRLAFLAAALQLPLQETTELLATSAPQLLATSLPRLQANLGQLSRAFSSRGLQPAQVLQERPDLLCQSPASIERKLEELPGALGMSRQRVRQLIAASPQLLRRSVATLQHRYCSLCQLFKIPDSFVEEFVVQEPQLLCLSAKTLKDKFDSLLQRYGAFADDVVDMVLVDPAMLLNADPESQAPAPAVKASRKKQRQALMEQQPQTGQVQQNLQQKSAATADSSPSGTANVLDLASDALQAAAASVVDVPPPPAESVMNNAQSSTTSSAATSTFSSSIKGADDELWQTALQQRRTKQQAARQRQRQRRLLNKQQLQQNEQLLPWQPPALAVSVHPGSATAMRSPVRQLLAFASATGLSAGQALQLWQQEPSLAQLPAAVITAQISQLSALVGLDDRSPGSSGWSAQQQQQQQWPAMHSYAQGAAASSSSGPVNSQPVLQVLVKEPALLAVPVGQLQVNMQGLCNLLNLDRTSELLPLLRLRPGLLLLAPEVSEYRLQHLAGLLQLSVPRTLQLVLQQPQLLVERPVLLAARLGSLCMLLGVQRGVATECVLREPLLLCVDDEVLQEKWQQLCERVGWAPDAVDVALADPAALIRDSTW